MRVQPDFAFRLVSAQPVCQSDPVELLQPCEDLVRTGAGLARQKLPATRNSLQFRRDDKFSYVSGPFNLHHIRFTADLAILDIVLL